MKDVCTENNDINARNWRRYVEMQSVPYSWIGWIKVKMLLQPQAIYKFNAVLLKFQ
jgi:hypothetical protein